MIRNSEPKDCKAICRLLCELENELFDAEKFDEIYQHDLHQPHHVCLVFEEDNQVTGFIHMRYETQWHHMEKICEIMELVVSEKHQGQSIGSKLIAKAIETAQKEGCHLIELSTNQKRKKAHRFYEKNGFLQTHYKYVKKI